MKAHIPIKIMLIIFLSNVLSMLAMNALTLSANLFIYVYCLFLILTSVLASNIKIKEMRPSFSLSKKEQYTLYLIYAIMAIMFILPRSGYLLEHFLGYSVDPVGDDIYHIQVMSSLINTTRYPALAYCDITKYLSHYYAPWMLSVFIYKLLNFSFVTIKFAHFIAYSIYILLILYAVFYFAYYLSTSKRHFYMFLYLILLQSGIAESLLLFNAPGVHHEWWMADYGIFLQFPSFFMLILWVMHHLISAASIILAWFLYNNSRLQADAKNRFIHYCVISLLLVNSFYSGMFVLLGAFPFILYFCAVNIRKYSAPLGIIFASSCLFASALLWIYLNRPNGFDFFFLKKNIIDFSSRFFGRANFLINITLSFPLFLFFLFLEFFIYFAGLIKFIKENDKARGEVVLAAISVLFILSTFFITHGWANNYAMRGSIIPVFILAYVISKSLAAVKYRHSLAKGIGILFLIFLSFGSVNELLTVYANDINGMRLINKSELDTRKLIYSVNTKGRAVKSVDYSVFNDKARYDLENNYFLFYEIEKIVMNNPRKLRTGDYDMMSNGPFLIWKYQDWNKS